MLQTEHRRDAAVVGLTSLLIALSIALLMVAIATNTFAQTKDDAAPAAVALSSAETPQASVVNLAALPPIELIDAETDVSVFLQAGVPEAMTVAALRRAWSIDPEIRDFRGLAELDWDLTEAGDSVFGFGPLDPAFDVQPMLAALFSDPPRSPVRTARRPTDIYSYLFSSNRSHARELSYE